MLDLVPANLPKNTNGFRTTHTCELCGFEPKTKNKYREKQDHLVMKHFKEKIDRIFPHSRPYACPTEECEFKGKDKQALLRHYTGKHGILDKYLKEALAEKGISYVPGEHGSKRKHSDINGSSKAKKMMLVNTNGQVNGNSNLLDPKDMLPKSPVPLNTHQLIATTPIHNSNGLNRANNDELRKEVEAMMASFQPQPHQEAVTNGSSTIKVLPSLPTTPVPVSIATMEVNGVGGEKKTVILSHNGQNKHVQLQQNPTTIFQTSQGGQHPPTSVVSLVKRNEVANGDPHSNNKQPTFILANGTKVHVTPMASNGLNGGQIHIPELILPDADGNNQHVQAIPIEVITSAVSNSNGQVVHAGQPVNGETCVVENEEVMWGAGNSLGPAVVVEAADTVPVTYIEAAEIVYSASMDNIDYDYLYPVTTTAVTSTEAAGTRSAVVDFKHF